MAPKSVTFRRHDHLVSVLFGDLLSHSYNTTFSVSCKFLLISLAIPTNITFWKCFVSCSFTFLVVALATTVSALVDEGTVE